MYMISTGFQRPMLPQGLPIRVPRSRAISASGAPEVTQPERISDDLDRFEDLGRWKVASPGPIGCVHRQPERENHGRPWCIGDDVTLAARRSSCRKRHIVPDTPPLSVVFTLWLSMHPGARARPRVLPAPEVRKSIQVMVDALQQRHVWSASRRNSAGPWKAEGSRSSNIAHWQPVEAMYMTASMTWRRSVVLGRPIFLRRRHERRRSTPTLDPSGSTCVAPVHGAHRIRAK